MSFKLPKYTHPDFELDKFINSPNCKYERVVKDGISPKGYHAMSMYPEYFKINGEWILAKESRMDTVCVIDDLENKRISTKEFRNLKVGDRVIVGRSENAEDGIFLHTDGFEDEYENIDKFAFRSGRSRETAFSKDYDNLYDLLRYEKSNKGHITFVIGTSVVLDLKAREALESLIRKGYVNALFCGTETAAIDLELGYFNTILGQDRFVKEVNSYLNTYKMIAKVWELGSIEKLIESKQIQNGIIKACIESHVEIIIPGTIRDRYPLPETIVDVYKAQDIMRNNQRKSTTTIMLGSILYTIATGNMTPSYMVDQDKVRPIYMYTVDIQEFAVNKLSDRGSLSATSIVTNVQDFIINLDKALEE